MARKLGVLAFVLLCTGCGGTEVAPQPPLVTQSVTMSMRAAEVARPTAPTSLAPKSCTPNPATVQAVPAPMIPRVAREPLSQEGNLAGAGVAAEIRPELERVCASGDFSLDTTRKALARHNARVFSVDESITGVAFVITVPQACVLGEVRPGHVRISVEGTTKSGLCE